MNPFICHLSLFLLGLGLLSVGADASAERVQLKLSSTATLGAERAIIRLDARNEGDSPLLNLVSQVQFQGRSYISNSIPRLLPNVSLSQSLQLPLPARLRGRYLMPLWLTYQNAAGQPLSSAHVAELNTGVAVDSDLRMGLSDLKLSEGRGEGRLDILNLASSPRKLSLESVTPMSLRLTGLPASVDVEGGAAIGLPFEAVADHAMQRGEYPVFILASFREEAVDHAVSVNGVAKIADTRSLPARVFAHTEIVYTCAILLISWVVLMGLYDRLLSKRTRIDEKSESR